MGLSRRQFTKEFKLAAVRRLEQGTPIAEAARGLEVNPNVLHRWRREFRQGPGNAFPGNGKQRWSEGRIAELERKVGQQTLEHAGLTVVTAVDGYDAVRQFEAHLSDIRAVLLDLTMPGMDGGEVFQYMIMTKPSVKVILSSGYDVHKVNVNVGARAPAAFLRKPYSPADLIEYSAQCYDIVE